MIKILVAVACCVVIVMPVIQAQTMYTTKYDYLNTEEILMNDRLLNNYFNCLMETGKCTPEGEYIKEVLPEAMKTNCQYCSEKQKVALPKFAKFLYENKNELWKQLEAKYDPEGTYMQQFIDNLKKLQH